MFVVQGEKFVHNFMNFGNYLWGATGYTIGFSGGVLSVGAHLNSLLNPRKNCYSSQFDSKDDQLSIYIGVLHAKTHNYRKNRK